MRTRPLIIGLIIVLASSGGLLEAFELQYPGEGGFFIGKTMIYMITGDSNKENIGKEGTFVFGQSRINIDGAEYYDCLFKSPTSESHFYLSLDSAGGDLMQKGYKVGITELNLKPAIKAVDYPISPGSNWTEKTDLTAKNIEIPGLGILPIPISVKNANVDTKVSAVTISVPAGTFDTLLVEATVSGSVMGIPMTLIQRTWLNEDNITVKRNFEFVKPSPLLIIEIGLSKLSPAPWDVNLDGVVNIVDLVIVGKQFGKQIEKVRIPNPDIDGNKAVDFQDIEAVVKHLGESY